MVGKIIDFSKDTLSGAITGHDSKRYTFTREDFKSDNLEPQRGMSVDFVPIEDKATDIFISLTEQGEKSRVTAGLLAIFLGGLGIHKFYLGKTGWGITYVLLCWTFIPAIVALIEGIIYFTKSDSDFNRLYVKKL